MSRIVARLGIAKGSIYQYFGGKLDLFLHVVDLASARLMRAATPPPHDETDVFVTLRAHMSATVLAAAAHPLEAALLRRAFTSNAPGVPDALAPRLEVRRRYVRDLVDRGIAHGAISPEFDRELAAHLVEAVIGAVGPALEESLGGFEPGWVGDPRVERAFDDAVRALRAGLGTGVRVTSRSAPSPPARSAAP